MKTSSPKFMYHVAPAKSRSSIEMYGLHPSFDQTGLDAIYLSVEPLGAEQNTDTWKIYVDGLDLLPDSSTPGFEGDWWMTTEPITPDRLRLLEPGYEVDEFGDVYAAEFQIPQKVYDLSVYKHQCPWCHGYLEDRGGVFTCTQCPFEYDTNTGDFAGKEAATLPNEPWNDPQWLRQEQGDYYGYGEHSEIENPYMPFIVLEDGRHWIGWDAHSHAYDWMMEDAEKELGIDWLEMKDAQGSVNFAGNEYQVHWPNHGLHRELEPQIVNEILNDVEETRRRLWESTNKEAASNTPKFLAGDTVIDKAYGWSGSVYGEPSFKEGEWWYWVQFFDKSGVVEDALFPEKDLERPSRYDKPEQMTIKDMFGITPEAEDYYRTASDEPQGVPKYTDGEQVIFRGDQGGGEIIQTEWWEGDWYYRVRKPDGKIVFAPEAACIQANEDQPGQFTLNDFGIPPSGEEYYRTASSQSAFIYDPNTDSLYLGQNHMTIQYKMQGRGEPAWETGSWDQGRRDADPSMVYGWVHTYPSQRRYISIYSDLAGHIVPSDEDVDRAVAAVRQEFGEDLDVEDGRKFLGEGLKPLPTSDKMSNVDTSNLQSMLANDAAASAAFDALTQAGGQVYIVGGAVRDAALGNNPKDIDLMCAGLTGEQIEQALGTVGRVDYTGKAFGVYRLRRGADDVEIAMPRTEQSTGVGHTDFEVNADPNIPIETDLGRRDFTVNAMAYDPVSDQIIDPHSGQEHAATGRLSLVNPNAFEDDPLRVVRALTAVSKHGLVPDDEIRQSMEQHASSLNHLPGERIQMEMDKLLSGKNPAEALELAYQTGVMDYLAPELIAMRGFDQKNPHHDLHVDQHTLAALDKMTKLTSDPDLRLAILFHDSGKPDSFWQDESKGPNGGGHFYRHVTDDGTVLGKDHQDVGAELARSFMERNRYPKARIDRVEKLIQMHMFPYIKTEKAARKFLREAGDPKTAMDLLKIREADSSGKNEKTESTFDKQAREKSESLLRQVIEKEQATSIRDLAIGGKDLIDAGIKPGPEMGRILNTLLERVIDNPELNTKDALLGMAQHI